MAQFDVTKLEDERTKKARKYLRLFLMDTEELNRLIRTKEIDDERLDLALELTVSDWNTTTPLIGRVTLGTFPSLYLLLHGATIQCLKMAGLYQSRNELTYNSGGSSFIRSNKTPYYQSWIQNFASEYEAKKLNYKIQKNVEGGYGKGFNSEYDLIGYDW
jgi:hypothetical protein